MCIENEDLVPVQEVITLRTVEDVASALKKLKRAGKIQEASRLEDAWSFGEAIFVENMFLPCQKMRN